MTDNNEDDLPSITYLGKLIRDEARSAIQAYRTARPTSTTASGPSAGFVASASSSGELVHQMRGIGSSEAWQLTDADGPTCIKRMPHWEGLFEFRTLQVIDNGAQPLDQDVPAAQAVAQAAPDGFVLVPKKLTEQMHVAIVRAIIRATGNDDCPPSVWTAALAAAPAAPAVESTNEYTRGIADGRAYQRKVDQKLLDRALGMAKPGPAEADATQAPHEVPNNTKGGA